MPAATRKPATPRKPTVARKREEDELLAAVFDLAKRLGILAYHPLPAQIRPGRYVTAGQGDAKGWVDAVFAGLGGQLYREFKATDGVVEPNQQKWMDRLAAGGADVAVWRPADLLSGRITRELNGIRRPRPALARVACGQLDQVVTDAAVFRAALEQIRDMDPTAASSSALLASVQRLAAEVLDGRHHPTHDQTREADRG